MTDSAQIRRSPWLRRFFVSPHEVRLEPPRHRLDGLAYLSETAHAIPGLEAVLTTSELAAHLGVPVQTIHDLRHAHRGPRGFLVGRERRYRVSEVQGRPDTVTDAECAFAAVAGHRAAPQAGSRFRTSGRAGRGLVEVGVWKAVRGEPHLEYVSASRRLWIESITRSRGGRTLVLGPQ